jgi:ribokinase
MAYRIMDRSASLFVLGSFVVACSAKVAHLPQPGESLRAEAFTVEAGGKGFNLALGALRLGANVDGIFAIGTDLFSQLAEAAFAQAGLPAGMLRRIGARTGSGIGFTDAVGENCLAVYPGSNQLLAAQDVRLVAQAVQKAGLLLAQFEIGDEPILEAFSLARRAGVRTLLNPSPYRPIEPDILKDTSILVLNQIEATCLAGTFGIDVGDGSLSNLERVAAILLEQGLEMFVVTLGRSGAIAFQRNGAPLHQPSFPVEVVDTLGAGDAFTAGFSASLIQGQSLTESLSIAAACGAVACTKIGVLSALPHRTELASFLEAQNNPHADE